MAAKAKALYLSSEDNKIMWRWAATEFAIFAMALLFIQTRWRVGREINLEAMLESGKALVKSVAGETLQYDWLTDAVVQRGGNIWIPSPWGLLMRVKAEAIDQCHSKASETINCLIIDYNGLQRWRGVNLYLICFGHFGRTVKYGGVFFGSI